MRQIEGVSTHTNKVRAKRRQHYRSCRCLGIKEYYKQHYANKPENISEMNKFSEKYNLLKLKRKESSTTIKDIESVVKLSKASYILSEFSQTNDPDFI